VKPRQEHKESINNVLGVTVTLDSRFDYALAKPSGCLMPFTVLVPHALAERCYLSEALLWVALSRFPLAYILENGVDAREEPKLIEGAEPSHPYSETITDEECTRVGLPPNPS
jgi:hypothetical protein